MTQTAGSPRVVLLGATGFVGSAVLRELARRPVRVRAVARHAAPVPGDARADIETLTVDLTEPGAMAAAVADADAVIHSVAYIKGSTTWRVEDGDTAAERVNVGLVRDLLDALRARGSGQKPAGVLFTGAASQVGPVTKELVDGSEPDAPKGEYDRQKLAGERLVLDASAAGEIQGASLRLPTVFGLGPTSTAADKGVVATMTRRALAGDPLTMWHDGTVRRDLLYIDDAAGALVTALDHLPALAGRHWVLGTGRGEPLGEVFRTVAELVATRTGKPRAPVVTVRPPAHAELADFRSLVIDSSAFRWITGWRPQVPLSVALQKTVAALAGSAEP
ncbi:NAD(P)-dependent oxidoreductase [Streptomyces sp. ST2-7A]|uniref:NAD-dependent epimerase/dehydratase family protein n=1 Tax=Streptomyces sp. ST2-7A TaxID=2907214 RepID=UPI001F245B96|nr:NAD-dependent epimerase/dehydratase [Streptomyces sp. ST2-7A]MCE7083353.1 NAD-dependent epimerase/dehydratase [Streptomyces sp. ST2-7A]